MDRYDFYHVESSHSSDSPKDVDFTGEILNKIRSSQNQQKWLQRLYEANPKFLENAYRQSEEGQEILSKVDIEMEETETEEESEVEIVTTPSSPPLVTRTSSSKRESVRPEPLEHVGICRLMKRLTLMQKCMLLFAIFDVGSDFYMWKFGLEDEDVEHLRPYVMIFAFVGTALWGLALAQLRSSLIRQEDAFVAMNNQMSITYATLLLEDIPQAVLVIIATNVMDKWTDAAQISLCCTILAIIEKSLRKYFLEKNLYVVDQGVHTSVCKRWFGSAKITRLEVAKLRQYAPDGETARAQSYPLYDKPDGEIIARVGRGHVVRVLSKEEDWMQIEMIPNICNFFQNSVFHEDIVYEGYVKSHEDGWQENWSFEWVEMDIKYKFAIQTEPFHSMVMLKDKPGGKNVRKAGLWTVSLVDKDSLHDYEFGERKYKYGKFKELPKVGAWISFGEGHKGKAWSPLKNLKTGDDNWRVEAHLRPLHFYADKGLHDIAIAMNAVMKKKVYMTFVFQKHYDLKFLLPNRLKIGWIPEETTIKENLSALLLDETHDPRLDHGATVFHVENDSWKILTMASTLDRAGAHDQSAEVFSQQHDSVCVVISDTEEKATFWSLRAKFEATNLEEITKVLHKI